MKYRIIKTETKKEIKYHLQYLGLILFWRKWKDVTDFCDTYVYTVYFKSIREAKEYLKPEKKPKYIESIVEEFLL